MASTTLESIMSADLPSDYVEDSETIAFQRSESDPESGTVEDSQTPLIASTDGIESPTIASKGSTGTAEWNGVTLPPHFEAFAIQRSTSDPESEAPDDSPKAVKQTTIGPDSPTMALLGSTGTPEWNSENSAHSSDGNLGFDDRMKRWAKRREEKKMQASSRRKSSGAGPTGYGEVARWTATASSANEVKLLEYFDEKRLPIGSLTKLGSGTFATVYKGLWTEERHGCAANTPVAVKVIKAHQSRPRWSKDGSMAPPKWLEREVKTSHVQLHENLLRVIETSVQTLPYMIVLEYCPGDALHEVVTGDPSITLARFSWLQRMKAALDIAAGMTHLHQQGIVHRDLKTQNVLLVHPVLTTDDPVHAKVCDFGLARYLPEEDHQTALTRHVGSWHSMAPEIFSNDCKYDAKVDVYSYGILLYHLCAGNVLFSEPSMSSSEFVIFASDGGRPREDAIPEATPPGLRVLMNDAWDGEPSLRPSFLEMTPRLIDCQNRLRPGYTESRGTMLGGIVDYLSRFSRFCCAGRHECKD